MISEDCLSGRGLFGEQAHISNNKCTESPFKEKKNRLQTQLQLYWLLLEKKKVLMIFLVFYTVFHCVALSAVTFICLLGVYL